MRRAEGPAARRRPSRTGLPAALLGALLALAMPSRAAAPAAAPDDAVRNRTDGGMAWIFRKDGRSALTSIVLFVRGGTRVEPEGKAGLAYLATRVAVDIPDEGKVRDIMVQSTRLSVAGLEDGTVVIVQCLSENLEEALRTVTRILRDPLFSGFRIDAVRESMRHQGKTELDDAVRAGRAEAKRTLFGPSGSGGPVWGTEATLKSIRKADVVAFYKSRFTAANMLLSVSSDLEEGDVSRLVGKYFSGFPEGSLLEAPPPVPVVPGERRIFVPRETKQTHLGLHFPLPPLSPRTYALAALAEDLLGGGVGSRLWPLRTRDHLAYTVDASAYFASGWGLLSAYVETSPEKLERARDSLAAALGDVALGRLGEEDLEIARRSAAARFLRTNELKELRARAALLFEARGLGFDFGDRYAEELGKVGLDDLNAFLREVLSPERGVEVVIGPESGTAAEPVAAPR